MLVAEMTRRKLDETIHLKYPVVLARHQRIRNLDN